MIKVNLSVRDSIHLDYLRWVFSSPSGDIIIRTKFDLGKFIVSQISSSSLPKNSNGTDNFISLQLPINHIDNKKPRFYFFDEAATTNINKAIAFYFDADFRQFCISGDEKEIKKHAVIKAFMRVLNISSNRDIFERLKKRDYRRRKLLDAYLVEGIRLIQSDTDNFCID